VFVSFLSIVKVTILQVNIHLLRGLYGNHYGWFTLSDI